MQRAVIHAFQYCPLCILLLHHVLVQPFFQLTAPFMSEISSLIVAVVKFCYFMNYTELKKEKSMNKYGIIAYATGLQINMWTNRNMRLISILLFLYTQFLNTSTLHFKCRVILQKPQKK